MTKHSLTFTVNIPGPFDFRLTVKKPAGWHWATLSEVFENETLYTALRLADWQLVGLKLQGGDATVEVTAYSARKLSEGEKQLLIDRVRTGLGADEDLDAFYSLAGNDELVWTVKDDLFGMRVGMVGDVFERAHLSRDTVRLHASGFSQGHPEGRKGSP